MLRKLRYACAVAALLTAFGACGDVPQDETRPPPEKVEQVQQAICGFWPFPACKYSDPDADLLGCGPSGSQPGPNRARFTWLANDQGEQCFEIDCSQQRNSVANLAAYGPGGNWNNHVLFTRNAPGVISQHYRDSFWGGQMWQVCSGCTVNDWGSAAGISSLICWAGQP